MENLVEEVERVAESGNLKVGLTKAVSGAWSPGFPAFYPPTSTPTPPTPTSSVSDALSVPKEDPEFRQRSQSSSSNEELDVNSWN